MGGWAAHEWLDSICDATRRGICDAVRYATRRDAGFATRFDADADGTRRGWHTDAERRDVVRIPTRSDADLRRGFTYRRDATRRGTVADAVRREPFRVRETVRNRTGIRFGFPKHGSGETVSVSVRFGSCPFQKTYHGCVSLEPGFCTMLQPDFEPDLGGG